MVLGALEAFFPLFFFSKKSKRELHGSTSNGLAVAALLAPLGPTSTGPMNPSILHVASHTHPTSTNAILKAASRLSAYLSSFRRRPHRAGSGMAPGTTVLATSPGDKHSPRGPLSSRLAMICSGLPIYIGNGIFNRTLEPGSCPLLVCSRGKL